YRCEEEAHGFFVFLLFVLFQPKNLCRSCAEINCESSHCNRERVCRRDSFKALDCPTRAGAGHSGTFPAMVSSTTFGAPLRSASIVSFSSLSLLPNRPKKVSDGKCGSVRCLNLLFDRESHRSFTSPRNASTSIDSIQLFL